MSTETKSKLWTFLNSNFGLFVLSSFVLSFLTWSYTQWSNAVEQKKILSEKRTKLETEISYRVQVMQNYFTSECSAEDNLDAKTFRDIDEIYSAAPNYRSIFPENQGKDLHLLIWEMGAIQAEAARERYVSCFDSLLQFHSYLGRLRNQVDAQGEFYGVPVDFRKEVDILTAQFRSALQWLTSSSHQKAGFAGEEKNDPKVERQEEQHSAR